MEDVASLLGAREGCHWHSARVVLPIHPGGSCYVRLNLHTPSLPCPAIRRTLLPFVLRLTTIVTRLQITPEAGATPSKVYY